MSGLKCPLPKCRGVARGMTGLMELQALHRHMLRAHAIQLNWDELLALRAGIEATADREQGRQAAPKDSANKAGNARASG